MRMTCVDVQKVLGSVHRMNKGGNKIVLDGEASYMESKKTGKRTKIHYDGGQYVLYIWAPAAASEVKKVKTKTEAASNRYAILATEEEPSFTRPARV